MKRSMRHPHPLRRYPITRGERFYSIFAGPFIFIIGLLLLIKFFALTPNVAAHISFSDLMLAIGSSFYRLFTAYIFALVAAIPLALLAVKNPFFEKIFLPMFDILESVPVLAFFPILILFFIKLNFINGAAIFILFLSMVWNIVFTVAGGLKMIPQEILYAAKVFHIKGFTYFHQVILPSIFPEIVTGSILAFAQGWNLVIVAEVLHVYIPHGTASQDLFGIGSVLVNATANGQTDLFMVCIGVMVAAIALMNYFVWQKLIHYAERFKFE